MNLGLYNLIPKKKHLLQNEINYQPKKTILSQKK